MPPVKMTRAEYERKYGTKPVVSSASTPVKMSRADYEAKYGKPEATAQESDKGFLGNLAVDVLRPVARMSTNLINAGQIAVGAKETSPLSGSFFGQVDAVGNTGKGFLADVKDSVGVGLELASYIPVAKGAKIGFDVLKGATSKSGREVLKRAVMPLIKEGAVGGGLAGGGTALQKDKGVGGVLLDTALGGAAGAAAAPLFGAGAAVTGKVLGKYTNISKLFKGEESKLAKEAAEKNLEKIAFYTRAPLDATEKMKFEGRRTGTEYSGLFGLGKKRFKLEDPDYLRAEAVKDLVDPRMSQADLNVDRIEKNVDLVHERDFMPLMREHPNVFEPKDLGDYLKNKVQTSKLLTKFDEQSRKIFDGVKERALEIFDEGGFPRTPEGVQQARMTVDKMIKEELGPRFFDKNHPMNADLKQAVLRLRTALNDFTHDSIRVKDISKLNKVEQFIREAKKRGIKMDTEGEIRDQLLKYFGVKVLPEDELAAITMRQLLKNMNLKLEAADNIWANSAKEVGKTKFENLKKASPYLGTAAAVGAGYGLSKLFSGSGVGSASGNNTN
jgi:hypothetical protein